MKPEIHVTDHAVLRYLERAHELDVDAVRRHLAGRVVNAARLGAVGVTVENIKLIMRQRGRDIHVVTVLRGDWPSRPGRGRRQ